MRAWVGRKRKVGFGQCEAYEGITAAWQGTGWCGNHPFMSGHLLFQLERTERDVNVFNEQRDGTWLEGCFCIA